MLRSPKPDSRVMEALTRIGALPVLGGTVAPIRARTIRQAITLTGRRALVRIAIEAETYRFLERFPGGAAISRGQLHVHAVNVASYSFTCAELCGAHADTAHLAGLLH